MLGLLSEAAATQPLLCVVDDEQWLDRASAQALGFAARRLGADPVGVVFAARVPGRDLAGLPELVVGGLATGDARVLLDSVLAGPLDARVREQIIADTHGNPLALLELPRRLTPVQLAGGFGVPGAEPLDGRIEDSFARQLEAMPAETQRLVQLAAADPSGDAALVWRAASRLIDEECLVADVTGTPPVSYAAMMLAAWRGREQEAAELIGGHQAGSDRTRSGLFGRLRRLRGRGAV